MADVKSMLNLTFIVFELFRDTHIAKDGAQVYRSTISNLTVNRRGT